MKKNGFTLIELIAAIILLGVISTITYTVVDNVIDNSKEAALKETISNLEGAAHLYREQNKLEFEKYDIDENPISFNELLENGYIKELPIDPYDNELLSGCVMYSWEETQYNFRYDERCKNIKPKLIDMDIVFNPLEEANINGWHNNDFYVKINVSGDSYKWCSGTEECEPISLIEGNEGEALINIESDNNMICVIGYDEINYSDKKCSEVYKLDKTKPIFTNIENEQINKNDNIDLASNVIINEELSGIDGTYSYYPNNVDTSIAGTTNVKYNVIDLAGNITEVDKEVIVVADPPEIQYAVLDNALNVNGWAKEDFYVKADIIDQSGLGIKSAKWCITTEDDCEPIADVVGTTITPLINVESNNNRICIQAVDNDNKITQVVCSDAYKLDKTSPNVGSINLVGTLGKNNWYISDVSISSIDGSDVLSGHDSTNIDISSITGNTLGTTVTLTTTDLAGNTISTSKVIKVDKNSPSISPKSLFVSINKGDFINTNSYFDVSYSVSGGNLVCTPEDTSSLESDQQMIYCEAVGDNGLTNSATKDIFVKRIPEILIANQNANKIYTYANDGEFILEKSLEKYSERYEDSRGRDRTRYLTILNDKVVASSDGGIIVANENTNKIYKYDLAGNLVWEKITERYSEEYRTSSGRHRTRYVTILNDKVVASSDGGIIVANENTNRIYKYDFNGDLVWEKSAERYSEEYRTSSGRHRTRYVTILNDRVLPSSDGGIIVVNENTNKIYKYDSNGDLSWEKSAEKYSEEYRTSSGRHRTRYVTILNDRVLSSDGGIIVVNENTNKIYKYDSNGELSWEKSVEKYSEEYRTSSGRYHTRYVTILNDKVVASDGGIIVVNQNVNKIYKYNSAGDLVWEKGATKYVGRCKTYNRLTNTNYYEDCDKTIFDNRVLSSSDGGLIVVNENANKIYKYDSDGNLVWDTITLKYVGRCKAYNHLTNTNYYEDCDKTILDDKVFGY